MQNISDVTTELLFIQWFLHHLYIKANKKISALSMAITLEIFSVVYIAELEFQ